MGRHGGPGSTAAKFRKKIAAARGISPARVEEWMVRHRMPTRPVHIRSAVPGDKIRQAKNRPAHELFRRLRQSLREPVPRGVVVTGRVPINKRTRR